MTKFLKFIKNVKSLVGVSSPTPLSEEELIQIKKEKALINEVNNLIHIKDNLGLEALIKNGYKFNEKQTKNLLKVLQKDSEKLTNSSIIINALKESFEAEIKSGYRQSIVKSIELIDTSVEYKKFNLFDFGDLKKVHNKIYDLLVNPVVASEVLKDNEFGKEIYKFNKKVHFYLSILTIENVYQSAGYNIELIENNHRQEFKNIMNEILPKVELSLNCIEKLYPDMPNVIIEERVNDLKDILAFRARITQPNEVKVKPNL